MQSIIGVAVDWRFEKDATQISFEEMMGDFGSAATAAALRRIVTTVGQDSSTDAELLRILFASEVDADTDQLRTSVSASPVLEPRRRVGVPTAWVCGDQCRTRV